MVIYNVKNIYVLDIAMKRDGHIKSVSYFLLLLVACTYIKHCALDTLTKLRPEQFNFFRGTLIYTVTEATREYKEKDGRDPVGSILAPVITVMERKRKSNYLQQVAHQDYTDNNTHTIIILFCINSRCSVIIHALYAQTYALC